jgi:hypothetical protein
MMCACGGKVSKLVRFEIKLSTMQLNLSHKLLSHK